MSAFGTWDWPDRTLLGPVGLFVLTVVAYAAGSRLALVFIDRSDLWSFFFAPAGVVAALLLRVRVRHWWVILLAAGTVEALMDLDFGYSPGTTAGFVAANLLGPLVGALIVTNRCGAPDLARLRDVTWFMVGPVIVGSAVAAAIGSGVADSLSEGDFATQFWQWWLGDALGVILVGSMILVWGSSPDRRPLQSVAGAVLLVGTLFITIWVLTMTHLPLVFLVLVGVVVAGVVFGPRAVATAAMVIAVTKAVHIALGVWSEVPGLSLADTLLVKQLRLGIYTAAGLIVAAVVHERAVASAAAIEAHSRALEAETAHRIEHEIAARLQQGLLPDEPIQHPALSVAARQATGSEAVMVGGDWYDITSLPDGRVAIVLGDVGGHGLEATTQMGRLRTAAAALAIHAKSAAELLANLDDYAQGRRAVEFATVSYAIFDPTSGLLTYASAGHPPMLLLTPSGDAVWLNRATTVPLYGGADAERIEASIDVEPGSLLVGYTDGLVENLDRDISKGLMRLEAITREIADRPVSDVCDHLFEAMGVHDTRRDDVVIVALRYEPQPSDSASREILIEIGEETFDVTVGEQDSAETAVETSVVRPDRPAPSSAPERADLDGPS